MILISAQDVQKSFGTHEVLKGVSFSLQKGEKMGLVGVNGCGKTTLMRIISGEAEADGGMVHKNRDLRIGYLRQVDDIALTDTVWEALLRVFEPVIAMERRLRGLEAQMEQNADPQTALRLTGEYQRLLDRYNEAEGYAYEGEMLGVLNGLGLKPDMHGRKVGTLSGGERQRVYLAMTLSQDTEILFLDEPTTYLDIGQKYEMLELIAQVNAMGKTVVMVLHDLPLAFSYSHQVVVLEKGRLAAQGPADQVFASGVPARVFGVKSQALEVDGRQEYFFYQA